MFWLVQLLCPIAIIVGLPVLVVWLITRERINRDNKNAEIVIKALENNSEVDTDKLVNALSEKGKSEEQILKLRLLRGSIFSLIGIAFLIITVIWLYQDPDIEECIWELIISGICLPIGIGYLIVYFVSRKQTKKRD